jgi:hypothetical protein
LRELDPETTLWIKSRRGGIIDLIKKEKQTLIEMYVGNRDMFVINYFERYIRAKEEAVERNID